MTRSSFVALLLLLAAIAPAGQLNAQTTRAEVPDGEIAARVGGHDITLGELDQAWEESDKVSYVQLQQQLYDTRRRALDIVIGEYLLEIEARARGITKGELLGQELPSRLTPVTDAEIESMYSRMHDQVPGATPEEKREWLRRMLEQQRPTQALGAFVGELRTASDAVQILLEPPRQSVQTAANDPVRGAADAPVVLVEFSDFQ